MRYPEMLKNSATPACPNATRSVAASDAWL
jgi:hypothetical protein